MAPSRVASLTSFTGRQMSRYRCKNPLIRPSPRIQITLPTRFPPWRLFRHGPLFVALLTPGRELVCATWRDWRGGRLSNENSLRPSPRRHSRRINVSMTLPMISAPATSVNSWSGTSGDVRESDSWSKRKSTGRLQGAPRNRRPSRPRPRDMEGSRRQTWKEAFWAERMLVWGSTRLLPSSLHLGYGTQNSNPTSEMGRGRVVTMKRMGTVNGPGP